MKQTLNPIILLDKKLNHLLLEISFLCQLKNYEELNFFTKELKEKVDVGTSYFWSTIEAEWTGPMA